VELRPVGLVDGDFAPAAMSKKSGRFSSFTKMRVSGMAFVAGSEMVAWRPVMRTEAQRTGFSR